MDGKGSILAHHLYRENFRVTKETEVGVVGAVWIILFGFGERSRTQVLPSPTGTSMISGIPGLKFVFLFLVMFIFSRL